VTEKPVVLFVGTHMDDIELGCGGTIQAFVRKGFGVVGVVISTDPKREKVSRKSAELLGYELVLGGLKESDITVEAAHRLVDETVRSRHPLVVFGPTQKDDHHHHVLVSTGTDSAARRAANLLHYCGPLRKHEFAPNVFFTFTEEEHQKKGQALTMIGEAYGPTRYFTEHYSMESAWLGQRVYEYEQRDEAPYLVRPDGEKWIPFAEGFEARRLRDPSFILS